MAVRKPTGKGKATKPKSAAAFVGKGGATSAASKQGTVNQTLRMPTVMAQQVDALREQSATYGKPPSRHEWILEAVAQRLERDE